MLPGEDGQRNALVVFAHHAGGRQNRFDRLGEAAATLGFKRFERIHVASKRTEDGLQSLAGGVMLMSEDVPVAGFDAGLGGGAPEGIVIINGSLEMDLVYGHAPFKFRGALRPGSGEQTAP